MKKLMALRWLLVATWGVLALMSYKSEAQSSCVDDVPTTSADEVFIDLPDGEVKHIASNLVYMRCSIGQVWSGGRCGGNAELFTWREALQKSTGYDFNNSSNWRLPNIKELSLIVERACVRPALNDRVFPDTPDDDYWTSSPSVQDPLRAWSIGFFNGTSSIRTKDSSMNIRLVRTALPGE